MESMVSLTMNSFSELEITSNQRILERTNGQMLAQSRSFKKKPSQPVIFGKKVSVSFLIFRFSSGELESLTKNILFLR